MYFHVHHRHRKQILISFPLYFFLLVKKSSKVGSHSSLNLFSMKHKSNGSIVWMKGDDPWLDYTKVYKDEIFDLINFVDSLDCKNNIEIKIYYN